MNKYKMHPPKPEKVASNLTPSKDQKILESFKCEVNVITCTSRASAQVSATGRFRCTHSNKPNNNNKQTNPNTQHKRKKYYHGKK